jgi:hypothetical protein
MALNSVLEILSGTKRLFVGLQGKKSDNSMETIKTNDAGAMKVDGIGSTLAEQKTQANAVNSVLTFSANILTIEIYNTDVLNDGVFTVNGIAINVPKGTTYKSTIGGTPGTTVTVTGSTSYIVSRYV